MLKKPCSFCSDGTCLQSGDRDTDVEKKLMDPKGSEWDELGGWGLRDIYAYTTLCRIDS